MPDTLRPQSGTGDEISPTPTPTTSPTTSPTMSPTTIPTGSTTYTRSHTTGSLLLAGGVSATYIKSHTTNSFLKASGVVTFPFTSDADGFVNKSLAAAVQTWRGDVGSPPGSLQHEIPGGSSVSGTEGTVWTGTWQDLGVPTGATVTSVRLTQALTKVAAVTGIVDPPLFIGPYVLKDLSNSITATLWTGRSIATGATDSSWIDAGTQPVVSLSQPSNTTFRIELARTYNSATSASFLTDQINLTTTYTIDGPTQVTRSLQFRWNTLSGAATSPCQPGVAAVGVGFVSSHCIPCDAGKVSSSLRLIWDVVAPASSPGCGKKLVCTELNLQWNGRRAVSRDLQSSWEIRKLAGNSRDYRWDVKFGWPVGSPNQLSWNVAPAIWGNNIALGWNTLTTIGAETDLNWDTNEIVGAEQDYSWNVYLVVGTEQETTWETTGPLGIELDLFYEVFATVSSELSSGWEVLKAISSSVDLHWNVKRSVTKNLDTSWSINRVTGKVLAARWKVTRSSGAELGISWKTFLQGAAEVNFRWYVHEQTKFTHRDRALLNKANTNIIDLLGRRGPSGGGFDSYRTVELYGGKILEPISIEPDPRTHRDEYYINSRDNRLYRRVWDRYEPERGLMVAHWAGVSD